MSVDANDFPERLKALDPRCSFIVQAPAGSGKTELLIQRYLVLLSIVEQPEEIAAITFTRKSAAEMRRRVLQALAEAAGCERPAEPHRALTWEHARAALERDAALGWHLEQNAARLRIQTIDALCASLARQMPVLAAFGAQPQSIDDASLLYREAAQATLDLLEDRRYSSDLASVLAHLDNNVASALDLLVSMLARRDQWLRAVARGLDREQLESALQAERLAAVERVERLFHRLGRASLIQGEGDAASMWQEMTEQLLTQKGEWRKRNGASQALADSEDSEVLREALHGLRRLPPGRYTDAQWEVLGAIARLLPVAVAQLKLAFAARGKADFVEIAQGALAALGEPEAPTDLLLSLDYRIQHILVDEFQDTSFTQYELLQRLTAGWQEGDGRTLFLVGDPMQSIYRFREADVSLFLRARREGLGSVKLEPLTLSANFRSQSDIVAWVNECFARVLPADEDLSAGAVPYAPSQAIHPAQAVGVMVHAFFNGDAEAEADQVATLVASARSRAPGDTIAVLVRSRAHLEEIVPRLKQSGQRFRAIEIEPLGHRQVVQDLLALTRALSHPADRVAWLAVLRAPWCGLTLMDLNTLVETNGEADRAQPGTPQDLFPETLSGIGHAASALIRPDMRTVWELMHDAARIGRIGTEGRARLERLRKILELSMAQRLRGTLRERVESAWLALGGAACAEEETDLEDAEIYFDYLESAEEAAELADPRAFEEGIDKLYALPDLYAGPGDVQLLTIHKAKGLEFDTVIVPGLGSPPRHRDPSLLQWMERPGEKGQSRLLLAPIKETGTSKDSIYDYLSCLDDEKESHEVARLLYVAATRAKKQLHLLGDTRTTGCDGAPELKAPSSGSLLEKLWPVVRGKFEERLRFSPEIELLGAHGAAQEVLIDQRLRRLPLDWRLPELSAALSWAAPRQRARSEGSIEFSWAGETARHVGSVVHRWLQRVAEDRLEGWDSRRIESLRDSVGKELACRGVPGDALSAAVERVIAALVNSVENDRGRWLLGPKVEARSELRISSLIDGQRALVVIDRVFTAEDGVRWIVDYKTSVHQGADREGFLDRERERYRPQLERYAKILGSEKSALGLYFPLLNGWRQWPAK